jgi:DNA methylase
LLGWTEVPTILLEHISSAQARAFLIADNKLTENGAWDDALLAEQLKTLIEAELDFSLDATGFEIGEINLLIEDHTPARRSKRDPADRFPAAAGAVQISRPGDLWLLGPHRILCGNPVDQDCYRRLMGNERAAMVIADPSSCHQMSNDGFSGFMKQLCALLVTYSTSGSVHSLFANCSFVSELATLGRQAYADSEDVRVWVKEGAGTGLLRSEQFALVLVFRNGKISGTQTDTGQTNPGPTNVCPYAEANVVSRSIVNERPRKPSRVAKPVAMLAAVLKDGSKSGDIVLDPFLDSGSTLVAAERTGRVCRGMEVDV